ncbi:conserved hypothetical protein [Vibrio phage 496E54-1]|nr:conserved hypothetical protein [Vibrio phage 495E54-1]CAH9013842.1 conserved hypothetical protein [Vibrio phage 496E54-1]
MQYTKTQIKNALLKMYNEDVQTMTHQQIANKYDKLHMQTGVNVFSLLNKGKSQNRFNICNLGGNSGGGRLGTLQKSIYRNV